MTAAPPHSRDELRKAYAEAWRKHGVGMPLTPLEALLADVIGLHPEYQPLLQNPDAAVFEPGAADSENPFLHLGLHVAVREQLAIDRPPGIRDLHRQLCLHHATAHAAEHALVDALAETLWEAQRTGRAPDEAHYLARARARLRSFGG